jgi:hypothetical protein
MDPPRANGTSKSSTGMERRVTISRRVSLPAEPTWLSQPRLFHRRARLASSVMAHVQPQEMMPCATPQRVPAINQWAVGGRYK